MVKAIGGAALIFFTCAGAFGQSLTFEVASIKQNKTAGGRPVAEFSAGGQRFSATNISLGVLLGVAYGVTPRQVSPGEFLLIDHLEKPSEN